jgi:hypothetical protein
VKLRRCAPGGFGNGLLFCAGDSRLLIRSGGTVVGESRKSSSLDGGAALLVVPRLGRPPDMTTIERVIGWVDL